MIKEIIQTRNNFQKIIIAIGIFSLMALPMRFEWVPIPQEDHLYFHSMFTFLYFIFALIISFTSYSYFQNFDKTKFIKRIKYFGIYAGIVLSCSIIDTIFQTYPEIAVLPLVFGFPILIWKSWNIK